MPTKKELYVAWRAHDQLDDAQRTCHEMPGWNEKLNHSVYNPGCKAWIEKYIQEHPVPRQIIKVEKKVFPRRACSFCHRQVREDRLYEEPTSGQLVCSTKCEKRVGMKVENVVVEKKQLEERKAMVEELARTGEVPKQELPPAPSLVPPSTVPIVPPSTVPIVPPSTLAPLPPAPIPVATPTVPVATPVPIVSGDTVKVAEVVAPEKPSKPDGTADKVE